MNPIRILKRKLYFVVAGYFQFWAKVYLTKWQPMVITVTGSSGKTTLLQMFEAQLGSEAIYSHKANSAFGIPFHILGLERKSFKIYEWLVFFIRAPFQAFRKPIDRKIYITEVDAERPGEARSLARLLNPDMLVWLSLEEAHGINYDKLVTDTSERKESVKREMAKEFGTLLAHTKHVAVLNSDNTFISEQAKNTHAAITYISEQDILGFKVERSSVGFKTPLGDVSIPALEPQAAALSAYAVMLILKQIHHEYDAAFTHFTLPPGRSSVFSGKKDTTIIDSTYNATFDGMRAMLNLMRDYSAFGEKWLVLGDMIEQGTSEQEEHETLAGMIMDVHPARVILVGPRLQKYTLPILKERKQNVYSCMRPDEALTYLEKELRGTETLLFKGARFLEGIVEKLLAHPEDASKLCRREAIWVERRKEWGV